MKLPDRVLIEITANGYSTTVLQGDKVLSKRSSVMQTPGLSKGEQKGDFYDDFRAKRLQSFVEELDGIGFGPFNVAGELMKLHNPDYQ